MKNFISCEEDQVIFDKYKDLIIPENEKYSLTNTIEKWASFVYSSSRTFRHKLKIEKKKNILIFTIGGENQVAETINGVTSGRIYSCSERLKIDTIKNAVIGETEYYETGNEKNITIEELCNYL